MIKTHIALFAFTCFLLTGCQSKAKVDESFLNEFSPSIRPKVQSLCERYDIDHEKEGIYFSNQALGVYTLIGLKNHNFEILRFTDRRYLPNSKVTDVSSHSGDYLQNKNWINFKTEHAENSGPQRRSSDNFEKLYYLNSPTASFLIQDIEDVANSISWSNTMGLEQSFFKKIHCNINDYKAYKGEDELAPNFKNLPDEMKALVLEQPLHLKVEFADNIRKQLAENDDPETAVEQQIRISTPTLQKLHQNQPICIMQGNGKGLSGYIDQSKTPFTTAWLSVYQFEGESNAQIAQQGDLISTFQAECESLD
ncbi:hypothetical protein [Acinetobacter wuhouensis]|uniref:hypothetical protein n=1 Tax=Acinetobacter wuhouensis TaxID=1879050 RepID=UPI001D187D2F|nr:hypothetical protein [Acinetobacter wuhouensis]